MSTETNKALVERFDSILTTGDLGQLDQLCGPDMVNHSPQQAGRRAGTHRNRITGLQSNPPGNRGGHHKPRTSL